MNDKNAFLNNKFNYIHYTEPNLFNQRRNCFYNINTQVNNKNNQMINSYKSIPLTQQRNFNTNKNKYKNMNYNYYDVTRNELDMRIYFCLKKLGLSHLQNIFEKKNIIFDDLLVLSMKDLEKLKIQKNDQIKIKKFTLDYIKNGSYYTLEELENYFRKKATLKYNHRKPMSAGNIRRNNNINYQRINTDYYRNKQQGKDPRLKSDGFNNNIYNYNNINNNYMNKNMRTLNNTNNIHKNMNIYPNYNSIDNEYNFINRINKNREYLNNNYKILNNTENNFYHRMNINQYYNDYENYNKRDKNKILINQINNYLSQKKNKNRNTSINRNKRTNKEKEKKIKNIFINKINSMQNKNNNQINLNNINKTNLVKSFEML